MNSPFKIIIKGLPTNLPSEEFMKTIENYQDDVLHKYYIPGKIKYYCYLSYTTNTLFDKG